MTPLKDSIGRTDLSGADLDPVDRVLAFLSQYTELSKTQRSLVRQLTRVERYSKGTLLLAKGDIARESWLVIQGCVRSFDPEPGGHGRTTDFHTEFQPAAPPTFGSDASSPISLECLEDVIATASTPEEERRAFAEHPEFDSICRVMGEALIASLQQAHIALQTRGPEQRYQDLVAQRPDLLQRVPQYHIASFLGIQPETLSRFRRKRVQRKSTPA